MTVNYGWMGDPLYKQLQEQGVQGITEENMSKYQKLADSISQLYYSGYMTDSQMEKARGKLSKDIGKFLKTLEVEP